MIFERLQTVDRKIMILYDVKQGSLVDVYRRFGGTCCLIVSVEDSVTETVGFSESGAFLLELDYMVLYLR